MKPLRICIVAPVSTAAYNQRLLDAVQPVMPPDVEVSVRNISTGHDCIEYRVDWLQNGYPVVQLAREIEREGYDGIWLSDFDMCGVEAAREVIDIPILGGFPPAAFTALALSQRLSIMTILPSTLAMQRGHMQAYGLQDSFASIRSIDCSVGDLDKLDKVVEKTFKAAMLAVQEDGAQSILLGCTGFVGVAARVTALLEDALHTYVPVIDPNQAGFSFLVSLVRMHLRPSRACYSKNS
ncbi:aspartate/glutamate racemase family protein [Janthinobacterium sp. MDB2-8]|uniref:aspartate/glutamate racemase family protein n=1 Tax=Janthinobacterium sp. MDB2-8 TaxID=1259338 RepID=UPI003F278301